MSTSLIPGPSLYLCLLWLCHSSLELISAFDVEPNQINEGKPNTQQRHAWLIRVILYSVIGGLTVLVVIIAIIICYLLSSRKELIIVKENDFETDDNNGEHQHENTSHSYKRLQRFSTNDHNDRSNGYSTNGNQNQHSSALPVIIQRPSISPSEAAFGLPQERSVYKSLSHEDIPLTPRSPMHHTGPHIVRIVEFEQSKQGSNSNSKSKTSIHHQDDHKKGPGPNRKRPEPPKAKKQIERFVFSSTFK